MHLQAFPELPTVDRVGIQNDLFARYKAGKITSDTVPPPNKRPAAYLISSLSKRWLLSALRDLVWLGRIWIATLNISKL